MKRCGFMMIYQAVSSASFIINDIIDYKQYCKIQLHVTKRWKHIQSYIVVCNLYNKDWFRITTRSVMLTWDICIDTWASLPYLIIQYFSKPGDTFLSGRRLVLPRLAWPRLALPCLVMPCLVLPGFECDAFLSNIKKNGIYMVMLF